MAEAISKNNAAVIRQKILGVILHLLSIKRCNRGLLNSQRYCQRESVQAACILLRLPAVCRGCDRLFVACVHSKYCVQMCASQQIRDALTGRS